LALRLQHLHSNFTMVPRALLLSHFGFLSSGQSYNSFLSPFDRERIITFFKFHSQFNI
jgi:hypothetical protein